jgi:hypothetical protein
VGGELKKPLVHCSAGIAPPVTKPGIRLFLPGIRSSKSKLDYPYHRCSCWQGKPCGLTKFLYSGKSLCGVLNPSEFVNLSATYLARLPQEVRDIIYRKCCLLPLSDPCAFRPGYRPEAVKVSGGKFGDFQERPRVDYISETGVLYFDVE